MHANTRKTRPAGAMLAFAALLAAALLTLTFLAFADRSTEARASEVPPCEISGVALEPALLGELFDWIDRNTAYGPTPEGERLRAVRGCDVGEEIVYEGVVLVVPSELRAAYDHEEKVVYLVRPWSDRNPHDVATLLHELVHFRQFAARDWPCPQATEWEAYKLQERWLAERGIDAGLDWVQILLLSRCKRDVHP